MLHGPAHCVGARGCARSAVPVRSVHGDRMVNTPLAATLTGGNRNDVTQLVRLLEEIPPVRDKRGRPRRRPDVVLGDHGYDHDRYRRLVWDLGVKPLIARRGTEHGSGLAHNAG